MSKLRRKGIRLKHYDYGQAGCYFVTICTKGKAHIFGEIVNEHEENPPSRVGAGISRHRMYLSPHGKLLMKPSKTSQKYTTMWIWIAILSCRTMFIC